MNTISARCHPKLCYIGCTRINRGSSSIAEERNTMRRNHLVTVDACWAIVNRQAAGRPRDASDDTARTVRRTSPRPWHDVVPFRTKEIRPCGPGT